MAINAGILEAVLRLRDEMSPALKTARKAAEDFGGIATGAFKAIAVVSGTVAAGISGITAALIALGSRGADISDVKAQFEILNRQIGNTGNVLGTMRQAFDGTVSDFDIMKTANLGLSQGLKLSEAQMKMTAEASRVLSDRIGGDNAQAYAVLTQAMATGQDRALKEVGINIDAAKAVETYAHSIGKATASLTESQQIHAKRQAILQALAQTLAISGKAETDFGDRVAQAKVGVQNFVDTFATAIAQSPAVNAMLEAAGNGLKKAFGENQQQAIKVLIGYVNEFAIFMVKAAQVGVEAAIVLNGSWSGLMAMFNLSLQGIKNTASEVAGIVAAVLEQESKIPVIGAMYKQAASNAREFSESLRAGALAAGAQVDAETKSGMAREAMLKTASTGLGNLAATMRKLSDEQKPVIEGSKKLAPALKSVGESGSSASKALDAYLSKLEEMGPLLASAFKNMGGTGSFREIAEQMGPALEQLSKQAEALGVKLPPAFQRAVDGTRRLAAADRELEEGHRAAARALEEQLDAVERSNEQYGQLVNIFNQVGDALGGKVGSGLKSLVGGLDQALTSYRGFQQAFFSGDTLGMISSGIGVVANTIGKIFGGLFGPSEQSKVRDMRNKFIESAGGLAELQRQADEAGVSLDRVFKAGKVKDYEAAVQSLNDSMNLHKKAMEETQKAIDKYGFTIEELGPKWQQQKLDEQVGGLMKDFELLVASGIDVTTVITKMGPAMQDYFKQAQAAGVGIPEAMRPALQKMLELGQLTDSAGNKLTSLEGVNFTQSLTEGLRSVVDEIRALIVALGGVPTSLPAINIPINAPSYGQGGYGGANGGGGGYGGGNYGGAAGGGGSVSVQPQPVNVAAPTVNVTTIIGGRQLASDYQRLDRAGFTTTRG